MKNALRALIVALTTLAFSGLCFAQAKPATPATPAAPAMEKKTEMKSEKPKATKATGEVTAVDAKAGTLTVKVKDKNINLTADSSKLGKVKVGDMVKVSYTDKDGKMNASSIAVVKGDSKAKAKTTGDTMEKKPATK